MKSPSRTETIASQMRGTELQSVQSLGHVLLTNIGWSDDNSASMAVAA